MNRQATMPLEPEASIQADQPTMTATCRQPSPESPSAVEPASVSVVVVNFNAGPVLRECLTAILPQVRQVVVVDNASEPAGFTDSIAPWSGDERVVIIRSDRNRGFAAGCNLGFAACSEATILLLNPDSVVHHGAVARMCEVLNSRPTIGMVGGYLVSPDGREQGGGRRAVPTPWRSAVRGFGLARLADRWPRLFSDFHLHLQPLPEGPIAVEAISGACMLLKREAFTAVGMMDEAYFLHCEDLDLCMRMARSGWEIQFVPDASVTHIKGACSRNRPIRVEWHKHRGMMRFYRSHFRHQYPLGLMGLVWLGVWGRFLAITILTGVRKYATRFGRPVRPAPSIAAPAVSPSSASAVLPSSAAP